ncbi:hypothetical protein SFC79_11295 [Nocardioides sp. S-58]|uniref:Uncharacterized protein n=1 Tax=Nocardioides renjunii TaxID=3095075 RepID=A0ABU5KD41_9ACTN|nr:hypothetical protein [Nocardioides sp. S-58]MDZ5662350.1 hypothetical protein [Nocardioides sp. S-58]
MRAAEYDRPIKNLDAFLTSLSNLIALMEPSDRWDGPRWRLMRGASEAEADRLWREVASLAGPAADAFNLSGMGIDYKPPGTWQTKPVNPALVWSSCFGESPIGEPALILMVGAQALGQLRHERDEQADRERGFVGAIAWFFTLAPRIRGAAGLPPRTVRGVALSSVIVLLQTLLVTVVGGALVYPLVEWLGWSF